MAILSGSPTQPELTSPDSEPIDPIAQAITEFEARGAEEHRRYVPGELAKRYRELGANEGYARLQQTVANAWHEDNAAYVYRDIGTPIYPTIRERARANPKALAAAEYSSALQAKMTLDALLVASNLAITRYSGDDRAGRVAAMAVANQVYDSLHPTRPPQARN